MRNLAAENLTKKIKDMINPVDPPDPSTFISIRRREETYSWIMYSRNRTTIYGSRHTATECKNNDMSITIINGDKEELLKKMKEVNILPYYHNEKVENIVEICVKKALSEN